MNNYIDKSSLDFELYQEWIETKRKLDFFKKKESDLRIKIFNKFDERCHVGTNSFFDCGMNIKVVKKVTTNIDAEALDKSWSDLPYAAKDVFKYTPSLDAKQYRGLAEDIKEVVDRFLIVKPAMPLLSIELSIDD